MHTQKDIHKINTASPLVYNNMGWLWGWLPQRAGSLGLNGGGAAAAVPPFQPLCYGFHPPTDITKIQNSKTLCCGFGFEDDGTIKAHQW